MYLHEYQSKDILNLNKILIPKSFLLDDLNQINSVINYFSCNKLVLKSQIHSGSRGKYGGIIITENTYESLYYNINKLLNKILITNQTGKSGKLVSKILIEEFINLENKFYLSFSLNRDINYIIITASKHGGEDIENIDYSKFLTLKIDPIFKITDFHVISIILYFSISKNLFLYVKNFLSTLLSIFLDKDLLLLEINPLSLFNDQLLVVDCKIEVDDNSLFRQIDIASLYDETQYEKFENIARINNLSYVQLDGNIGCMVNGAGLAMATMDLIKSNNGNPSNFLDIGGDANEDKILTAINILISNKNVKCIFINIFGGIIKCDIVAKSVVSSIKKLNVSIPIIIRLIGNMSHEAIEIIKESNLEIEIEQDLLTAVKKVIKLC
jgi:succinyl-CoA synthetase beta subunit